MAEKSPKVQPARQRNVLTEARFHVGLELQKAADVAERGAEFWQGVFLLQEWLLVHCFWKLGPIKGALMKAAVLTRDDGERNLDLQMRPVWAILFIMFSKIL